jgi:hypothetical protein
VSLVIPQRVVQVETPICIKLSRLVRQRCLRLGTTLPAMSRCFQQLLARFPFPFLCAQQRRPITLKLMVQRLPCAVMDRMREASFALSPHDELMETACSASHRGRIPGGIRTDPHQPRNRHQAAIE